VKVVSLFAGCGGFDLGFEKAGVDIVWANEYDSSMSLIIKEAEDLKHYPQIVAVKNNV